MLTIGDLSKSTGVKVTTIRYYEQIGLLPEPDRSSGNRRLYDRPAQDRLAFVRHARDLGFSLEAIRELLDLSDDPDRSCRAADDIARRQLREVKARISRLDALRGELERMLKHCSSGTIADCRVIEVLGNHALCADAHDAGDHGRESQWSRGPGLTGPAPASISRPPRSGGCVFQGKP